MGILDLFVRAPKPKKENLEAGLSKIGHSWWERLSKIAVGKSTVDRDTLDRLEELLISADVGVSTTLKIIGAIEQRIAREKYLTTGELNQVLREEVTHLLLMPPKQVTPIPIPLSPYVILVVGVNGVGKTTTIGKLAAQFTAAGKRIILAAADTFRAAAVEQLTIWGKRIGATVVTRAMQSDPSAVVYDALQQGIREQVDMILVDTAGRLHTKTHLIAELAKIKRTIHKCLPGAPQEILLVLDGTTGQNAYVQAEVFTTALQVTGIVLTKLDGTAKGGMILGIVDQFAVPIQYVGVGEKIEDLYPFDATAFIAALFQKW